jgi:GTP-binding protein
VTSASTVDQLPATRGEVAVVGRSNVGKSSLLNALAGRKELAKTSSKPGKTQLLNCFATDRGGTIVDLPGFGYASSASKTTRADWRRRMDSYLLERDGLALALLLVDGRIGPAPLDIEVLAWLRDHDVRFDLVATKHDGVKSSQRERRKRDLAAGCGVTPAEVAWVSAETGVGLDLLRSRVRDALAG